MKRTGTVKITVTAFCVAINIVGAYLALILRLPIYLDSVGTILNAAVLGPVYGMITACLSSVFSGITSDVYALYFMPDGMITGLIAGLLFRTKWFQKWRLPFGVLFLAVPGTIISSCIAAYLFGGVTSLGSSMLVQVLHHIGLNMVVSVFVVQMLTDYADRLVSVVIARTVQSHLGSRFTALLKGKKPNGAL